MGGATRLSTAGLEVEKEEAETKVTAFIKHLLFVLRGVRTIVLEPGQPHTFAENLLCAEPGLTWEYTWATILRT